MIESVVTIVKGCHDYYIITIFINPINKTTFLGIFRILCYEWNLFLSIKPNNSVDLLPLPLHLTYSLSFYLSIKLWYYLFLCAINMLIMMENKNNDEGNNSFDCSLSSGQCCFRTVFGSPSKVILGKDYKLVTIVLEKQKVT